MADDTQEFDGYVTKYALSAGIQKRRLLLLFGGMVALANSRYAYFHGEGRDWHRTYASARERAEAMRKAKIASLQKTIAKLEKPFPEQEPAPEPGKWR